MQTDELLKVNRAASKVFVPGPDYLGNIARETIRQLREAAPQKKIEARVESSPLVLQVKETLEALRRPAVV
jgi:hypothetical protein